MDSSQTEPLPKCSKKSAQQLAAQQQLQSPLVPVLQPQKPLSSNPVKNVKFTASELETPETALRAIKTKAVLAGKHNVGSTLSNNFQAKRGSLESTIARLKDRVQMSESDRIAYKAVNPNIALEKSLDRPRAQESKERRGKASQSSQSPEATKVKFKAKQSSKQIHNVPPPTGSNLTAQDTPAVTAGSFDSPTQFDKANLQFKDLYQWIAGYVSSESESSQEFIKSIVEKLIVYRAKNINETWLYSIVWPILHHAVSEPHCAEDCAKLAMKLSPLLTRTFEPIGCWGKPMTFMSYLLSQFQKEFKACFSSVKYGECPNKAHKRAVGMIRFIVELYNVGMLTQDTVIKDIEVLLDRGQHAYDLESLECLCQLLSAIGPKIEAQYLSEYVFRMEKMVCFMKGNQKFSKVGSMIQKIIDLYHNKWKAKQKMFNNLTKRNVLSKSL